MSENQNKLTEEEESSIRSTDEQTLDINDENTISKEFDTTDEEPQEETLYFGRFTRGTWRGGLLGIAISYFMLALLGFANDYFKLNIDSLLNNSIFTYGLLIILCYVGGKIGKTLEAKAKENK